MSLFNQSPKAYLMLADGQIFEGRSFGAKGTVIGEVVFTTGLTGFQETLTDPSYYGQIVTQTFPLIGNYGVNHEDNESSRSYVSGYIVREWCNAPSNFRCEGNVNDFLEQHNIIGINNIDTRRLTRIIRETGVMNGVITTEDVYSKKDELLEQIRAFSVNNAVKSVTNSETITYPAENKKFRVVLFDFGYKRNIRQELIKRGCEVIVVPADTTAETVKEIAPDGIMFSNGPGDPAENVEIIKNIKEIEKLGIPIFGICLGHQLMALANGGKTEKLKYGHRGANQPVIDLESGLTYVTSQNHGYAVVGDSISPEIGKVSHINANDKTCEGIRYTAVNAFTVQFHPEAHGGPLDTDYLFDEFVKNMERAGE
ncbi:MAG: carbamoyl phosphate synthase small subunit [Ruminococcus flavefaciens]|nr:carbamoyl phosphate synthase small subunit [Ruminococcus flavefaciens]MCM1362196.1 carbamoyl phosphate synthase small subunit [Clostridiales bacterium]MCM1435885.1 carbamoyl phosphate synthase small subunit [Ruminococcus flavefaciens]